MNSATSVFVRPLICLSLNSTSSRTFFFVFASSSTSLIILFTSVFIWLYSSAVLKGLPARPLKPVIRLLVYFEILLRSFLRFSAVLTLLRGFTLVVVTVVRALLTKLLTASFRCLAFTPAFLIVSTTPTFLAAFLKRLRGFATFGTFLLGSGFTTLVRSLFLMFALRVSSPILRSKFLIRIAFFCARILAFSCSLTRRLCSASASFRSFSFLAFCFFASALAMF